MDSNNSLWHQQDSPIEAYLPMASANAVRLSPRVENQKLKLELLRESRPKLESLPVSVVVHQHLVRAGCMFFGTATRRTLTRLHRPFCKRKSRLFRIDGILGNSENGLHFRIRSVLNVERKSNISWPTGSNWKTKVKEQQGSKNLFSNTRQGGSKRKVLVAKVAL